MKKVVVVFGIIGMLSGCSALDSVNNTLAEKTKIVEYYRIFDIHTHANRDTVIAAASDGLGRHVNSAKEVTPIPDFSVPPKKPGRFKLINPLKGTKLAAFAQMGGQAPTKIASCNGAVWTAQADREVEGSNSLKLTVCLWQYQQGYHLDTYAIFTKKTGGLMQISRSLSDAVVGTPEEWTEKTFLDIVRQIRTKTGAKITYLEGFPKLQGTPWLDSEGDM